MLRLTEFDAEYDMLESDPIRDFLVKGLDASVRYSRAVGYFSSAILSVVPQAFTNFAERGGKIQLVCSPFLSPVDARMLDRLDFDTLETNLDDALLEIEDDNPLTAPLNLLCYLIKMGCLEVKLAIPKAGTNGLFHQKIGFFEDKEGDFVSFHGSNNETLSAWFGINSESFTVHSGWADGKEATIARKKKQQFEKFWSDRYPNFDFLPLKAGLRFVETRANEDADLDTLKRKVKEWVEEAGPTGGLGDGSKVEPFQLRDYQLSVLQNWEEHEFRGVVSFATGAGKTITALEGMRRWFDRDSRNKCVVMVPSARLQKQWLSEIRQFVGLSDAHILLVGGLGKSKEWASAVAGFTSGRESEEKLIVLAVMDSASKGLFYNRISWGGHLLLVADEMHNLGAPSYKTLLEKQDVGAILGLTATPERYDEQETLFLRGIFGSDLDPVIDIVEAQKLKVLVPYEYLVDTVTLVEDEQKKYQSLSNRISQLVAIQRHGKLSKANLAELEQKRIDRARVLRKAVHKPDLAAKLIRQNYVDGDYWVVFCADSEQLGEIRSRLADLMPYTYFTGMDGDQDATLRAFELSGGIILSINMLDEGVDIREINRGLIVASTQSARQYIQRRGRILRSIPGKAKLAKIWDLMVVDDDGFVYNEAEVVRGLEFAEAAINSSIKQEVSSLSRNQTEINIDKVITEGIM